MMTTMNARDEAIRTIRSELKRRSGKAWSVTGGRGTAWGWITITVPPARQVRGCMTSSDREELSQLLGMTVHDQGAHVPDSRAYRDEYVDRARGLTPATHGTPYWD